MIGIPGSGKSTFVQKNLANSVKCSADDYFMIDGVYKFDPKKLGEAHDQCFKNAVKAMLAGKDVVIDNTNLRIEHIQKYIDAAVNLSCLTELHLNFIICEPELALSRNTHGVPERMYARFDEEFYHMSTDHQKLIVPTHVFWLAHFYGG